MKKHNYCTPMSEQLTLLNEEPLAASGVVSTDSSIDLGFGGFDLDGDIDPSSRSLEGMLPE